MTLRVNPNQTPDLQAALQTAQQQRDDALIQLSTGRRVNKPSDDAAAAAQVVTNHDQSSQIDSFQSSSSNIAGQQQTADSTLSSVVTALQRAITLGVQGGNSGTLSDSNRAAIADELRSIQTQLVSLANVAYQGRFIFSGTEQGTAPYVVDSTAPSGVRYVGNDGVNTVAIGTGYQLQVNLPGSQLFSSPRGDVFQSVQDLIDAVSTNTGIDTAVSGVRQAFDFVTAQRVFYGNGLNQIQSQQTFLDTQKTQLSSQENVIAGADIAAAASQVVNSENARNATLAAIGRVSQTTLFDFLK
jgi:flagellar hook-associated protein 3 FlgL